MDKTIEITNAQIAETIVRTAYSRIHDCLLVLKDQNLEAKEVKITPTAQDRMANMLIQDFANAHNPSNGSAPLRHAKMKDRDRDLLIASRFNDLPMQTKNAIAVSAFRSMVGNFNASPISQGIHFRF